MLSPFLIVGLGGSGGKTLQTLRDNLMRQLRQAGWQRDTLPAAWQLLQLDVPPVQGEVQADLPDPLTGDSYVGLVTGGVSYSTLDQALTDRIAGNEMARQAMAGWRPNADAVTVPIERGAGQYRAIGRLLTVYHIDRVKRALDDAIIRMNTLNSASELKEVAALLGMDPSGSPGQPTVIVIASIAGGTGAGMFMDVCDVLRATGNTWASESVALLFTPDVFDELPPQARSGVRPNALASLSEILAGFWDQDGFGDDESALLQLVGVAPLEGQNRIGPRFPFLMGRSNGSVTFERQNDVYRSAGRALSSWVTNQEIQSVMSNYITGNWVQSSLMADKMPFKDRGQENPFQSMGFARVSLGRDRFLQYSAERLARGAVERLLEGHTEGRRFDDHRSDDALLQERVEQAVGEFLATSGLDIDPSAAVNDVLELAVFRQLRDSLQQELLNVVYAETTEMPGDELQYRGQVELDSRRERFDRGFQDHYRRRLTQWAQTAQEEFVEFLLAQAAIHGIPATRTLAARLSAHISSTVVPALNKAGNDQLASSARPVDVPVTASVAGDSPEARTVIAGFGTHVSGRNLGQALQLFAQLLDEFRGKVIDPATQSLGDAFAELRSQQSDAESWPSPQTDDIPRRLRPTPNERILLEPGDFPGQLSELLRRQFDAADAVGAWNLGLAAVVVGTEDQRADRIKALIAAGGRWVPQQPELRPDRSVQPRAMSVHFDLRPRQLRARCEGFVATPNTVLGRYVGESMAEFLSQQVPAEERTKRVRAFEREFTEAMKASAPMAAINPGVVLRVHESQPGVQRVFSGVPFPAGSDAHKAVESVLVAHGLTEADRAAAYRDAPSAQHIDVFTMLSAPMEPAVFDSLTKPIKQQWDRASASGPDELAEFWRHRRTRPLPQSIPMAPHVRGSMVRGWFTARLLGQLQDSIDADGNGDLRIFAPSEGAIEGTWKGFPLPLLLPQGAGREDRVAGVLKSAAIAILEVNNGNMAPVEAYGRLRTLGAARGGMMSAYPVVNPELEQWIRDGILPPGAPTPRPEWAGDANSSLDERKRLMLHRLRRWRDTYSQQIFEPVRGLRDIGMAPRSWELRHDYLSALDDLARAIERITEIEIDDL